MVGSAAALVVGAVLHPQEDETLTGDAQTSAWLGDPWWVPSHMILVLAEVLLLVGLIGLLVGRPDLPTRVRRAAQVASVSTGLWLVESVPHVLSAGDAHAIGHGGATPSFTLFQQLSPVVYPLVGLSVSALALVGGRHLTHPVFSVVGVVGGLAYAAAPLAENVMGIDSLDFLYAVGLLMAGWFAAVGVTELTRRLTPR